MICQICGCEVQRTSNSQKYCPDCGKEIRKAQVKNWYKANAEYRRKYERRYYHDHKWRKNHDG